MPKRLTGCFSARERRARTCLSSTSPAEVERVDHWVMRIEKLAVWRAD